MMKPLWKQTMSAVEWTIWVVLLCAVGSAIIVGCQRPDGPVVVCIGGQVHVTSITQKFGDSAIAAAAGAIRWHPAAISTQYDREDAAWHETGLDRYCEAVPTGTPPMAPVGTSTAGETLKVGCNEVITYEAGTVKRNDPRTTAEVTPIP